MKKILLFESGFGGHRPLYIFSLAKYWHEHIFDGELIIIITDNFVNAHQDVIEKVSSFKRADINFVVLPSADSNYLNSSNSLIQRALREWSILLKSAQKEGVSNCFAMYIDPFLLPLALNQKITSSITLSGIYFHPTLHYGRFKNSTVSLGERIKRWPKRVLLKFALRNNRLKYLFSLDPLAVPHINELAKVQKALFLPESIILSQNNDYSNGAFWDSLNIKSGRKVFLVFGAIARRKGIYHLLDAVSYLPDEISNNTCLLFVGSINKEDKGHFTQRIAEISENSDIQIVVRDEFIDEAEIQDLFKRSDVILALYPNHVGSSGIILQAAAAKRPVLASDYGLVGEIVKRNRFGITANANDPVDVANKMVEISMRGDKTCDFSSMETFVNQNNYEKFAEVIYKNIKH